MEGIAVTRACFRECGFGYKEKKGPQRHMATKLVMIAVASPSRFLPHPGDADVSPT